jgi:hypothetical protein
MLPLHTLQHFGKHFNDRLGYQHYGRYFITARYAELVENPIMYSKPDYTTFTVDGWKSLLVFILLLESYCRKHNARDENHDDSTKKPFRKK